MIKSADADRFQEIRLNLRFLVERAPRESPLALVPILQLSLQEMKKVRQKILRVKPKTLKTIVVEEIVVEPARVVSPPPQPPAPQLQVVRAPKPTPLLPLPQPSTHSRRIHTSTTYNPERYLPYRILWAKAIIRATYDYALWKDSKDLRLRKIAREAETWIFESSDGDLSFESICFAYDFPVERIRQRTRLLTKHDVKKLEFRERQGRGDLLKDLDGDSR